MSRSVRVAIAALTAMTAWLAAARASAQPSAYPSTDPGLDPAVPMGLVFAGLGSVALVTGGVLFTNGHPVREQRGSRVAVSTVEQNLGVALLGAGAGLVAVGLPAFFGGLYARHEHMSDGRMGAGIVLMALAAAGGSMGAGLLAAPDLRGAELGAGLGLGLGGTFFSLGLPLLVSGAPPPRQDIHSPATAYVGYSLLGIGGATVSGGSLAFVVPRLAGTCADATCIDEVLIGLHVVVLGVSEIITAISLIVVGNAAPFGPVRF